MGSLCNSVYVFLIINVMVKLWYYDQFVGYLSQLRWYDDPTNKI
jgi:hypothetical protein